VVAAPADMPSLRTLKSSLGRKSLLRLVLAVLAAAPETGQQVAQAERVRSVHISPQRAALAARADILHRSDSVGPEGQDPAGM
jgi:hypothetical protein